MVRRDGKLTAENIKAPMREIRRALLEADVRPRPRRLLSCLHLVHHIRLSLPQFKLTACSPCVLGHGPFVRSHGALGAVELDVRAAEHAARPAPGNALLSVCNQACADAGCLLRAGQPAHRAALCGERGSGGAGRQGTEYARVGQHTGKRKEHQACANVSCGARAGQPAHRAAVCGKRGGGGAGREGGEGRLLRNP